MRQQLHSVVHPQDDQLYGPDWVTHLLPHHELWQRCHTFGPASESLLERRCQLSRVEASSSHDLSPRPLPADPASSVPIPDITKQVSEGYHTMKERWKVACTRDSEILHAYAVPCKHADRRTHSRCHQRRILPSYGGLWQLVKVCCQDAVMRPCFAQHLQQAQALGRQKYGLLSPKCTCKQTTASHTFA